MQLIEEIAHWLTVSQFTDYCELSLCTELCCQYSCMHICSLINLIHCTCQIRNKNY